MLSRNLVGRALCAFIEHSRTLDQVLGGGHPIPPCRYSGS
jgi:hypothetical protein